VADRVNRLALNMEELDLMKCIGDQAGRHLLNIRLSEQLLRSKELEAFQAMSTFFVHDLKNVAFTLSLMLENLPKRFEDPDFRKDALQSIDRTVRRIQGLIANLGLVRQQLELNVREVDLNELLRATLKGLDPTVQELVQTDLNPLPLARVDPDQMQSVVVNLLLNARDAIHGSGGIRLETRAAKGWVVVSVSDTGPGMTLEFIQRSLFRPFRTTKKNGVGVGLFHAKKVIEAHQGRIEVRSKPGEGTVFLLHIPIENP
jgi:putative PEP-CTERM system histidine kinase